MTPQTVTVTSARPLTPAERKRAQRKRYWAALMAGEPLAGLTLAALLKALPALVAGKHQSTLALVLVELGRRGGVTVTAD